MGLLYVSIISFRVRLGKPLVPGPDRCAIKSGQLRVCMTCSVVGLPLVSPENRVSVTESLRAHSFRMATRPSEVRRSHDWADFFLDCSEAKNL